MTLAEPTQSGVEIKSRSFVLDTGGLDLESTLDGGQAFRWWRVSGAGDSAAYDGVIGETAVRMRELGLGSATLRQAQDGGGRLVPQSPTEGSDAAKFGHNHSTRSTAVLSQLALSEVEGKGGALQGSLRADGDVLVEVRSEAVPVGFDAVVADYLGLSGPNRDIHQFRAAFAEDPCIGPAVSGFAGLRVLRQDPWECLVSFICSSTSNIPRIKLNVGSVATQLGHHIGPGPNDFAFPGPEDVARAGEQYLRELGLGFRAKYVVPAAEAVASGDLDLFALRQASYEEARAALVRLNGVGEKVADCVLAFSLDKAEAFPVDRHIRRALERWYGLPEGANNSKAADFARARFGRSGTLANQYMFHRERLASRANWGGRHIAHALPEDR